MLPYKLVSRPTFNLMFLSLAAFILTGCASIVTGHNQPVSVETYPVTNAVCTLQNNKGTWYISNTPGSTVVRRSFNDMQIVCQKNGFRTTTKIISSSTKPMVFGNVLFGGVVGAGVDVASGAAYDYPNNIHVPMQRA